MDESRSGRFKINSNAVDILDNTQQGEVSDLTESDKLSNVSGKFSKS